MADSLILSVDQSTQATKAFLFDRAGRLVARCAKPHSQIYPEAGFVEHDPEELFANTCAVIVQLLAESGTAPGEVALLALTNQRETIVAWDAETGKPLHNALVWQDERGAGICGELAARGSGPLVRARTGLMLDSYFSASKLAWLVRHSPSVRSALASGRLMAGTVDSWLIWKLTKGRTFATDYSNASRTLLFDIGKLAWDEELLALFGLEGILLPEARCSDAFYGEALIPGIGPISGAGAGADARIPIFGVMGDSHAALFGHCGWNPGDAKASYGTGSSIMMNIGPSPRPAPEGIVLSLAWGAGGRPSYVFEGNIHSTGYTLRWLRENLGLFSSDEEAERLAAELADSGGVYFVPAFSGLGAPYWEHGIRASITGLSHGSDRRHVIRAGLESMAYQVMDLMAVMFADSPSPPSLVHVDGGPSRNALLMQFQADMLRLPVVVPPQQELSALGVAYMGGLGGGFWKDRAVVGALEADSRRFEPSMEPGRRQVLIAGWRSAVAQAISRKVE
jgi:glycerol kinase